MGNFIIANHIFTGSKPATGLYIVSTPIGNLADITIRALEVLAGADIIACEDTRVTAKLLNRYGIRAKKRAYHEHNADIEGPKLLEKIAAGMAIALVSDAGTPLVSDPGNRLVKAAKERGFCVFPIPGASAPVAALTASGLPSNCFTFAGFLPSKSGQRKSRLEQFKGTTGSVIFFETSSRLLSSLHDMIEVFGNSHRACISRELTKLHEENRNDTLLALSEHYRQNPPKGEIVVTIAPQEIGKEIDPDELLTELLADMSVSRAASAAANLTGISKRELYQRALKISED